MASRLLTMCSIISFLVISFLYYLKMQDGYYLVEYSLSPDLKYVGVIVSNMGGGGPGYCRDLVYKFPKNNYLPDFSKEKKNKVYLVKELNCGEAKMLNWVSGKLIIVKKQ